MQTSTFEFDLREGVVSDEFFAAYRAFTTASQKQLLETSRAIRGDRTSDEMSTFRAVSKSLDKQALEKMLAGMTVTQRVDFGHMITIGYEAAKAEALAAIEDVLL